ncbi:hypothetical protein ACFL54_00075 [Planctomycetota bacterium]
MSGQTHDPVENILENAVQLPEPRRSFRDELYGKMEKTYDMQGAPRDTHAPKIAPASRRTILLLAAAVLLLILLPLTRKNSALEQAGDNAATAAVTWVNTSTAFDEGSGYAGSGPLYQYEVIQAAEIVGLFHVTMIFNNGNKQQAGLMPLEYYKGNLAESNVDAIDTRQGFTQGCCFDMVDEYFEVGALYILCLEKQTDTWGFPEQQEEQLGYILVDDHGWYWDDDHKPIRMMPRTSLIKVPSRFDKKVVWIKEQCRLEQAIIKGDIDELWRLSENKEATGEPMYDGSYLCGRPDTIGELACNKIRLLACDNAELRARILPGIEHSFTSFEQYMEDMKSENYLTGVWGVLPELRSLETQSFRRWLFDEGELENRLWLYNGSAEDLQLIIAHYDSVGWPPEPELAGITTYFNSVGWPLRPCLVQKRRITPQQLLLKYLEENWLKEKTEQLCQTAFDTLVKQYVQSSESWNLESIVELTCSIPTYRMVENTAAELREVFLSMLIGILNGEYSDLTNDKLNIRLPLGEVTHMFSKYFVGPARQRLVSALENLLNNCIRDLEYHHNQELPNSAHYGFAGSMDDIVRAAGMFGVDTTVVILKQLKQQKFPQGWRGIEEYYEDIPRHIDDALEKISKRNETASQPPGTVDPAAVTWLNASAKVVQVNGYFPSPPLNQYEVIQEADIVGLFQVTMIFNNGDKQQAGLMPLEYYKGNLAESHVDAIDTRQKFTHGCCIEMIDETFEVGTLYILCLKKRRGSDLENGQPGYNIVNDHRWYWDVNDKPIRKTPRQCLIQVPSRYDKRITLIKKLCRLEKAIITSDIEELMRLSKTRIPKPGGSDLHIGQNKISWDAGQRIRVLARNNEELRARILPLLKHSFTSYEQYRKDFNTDSYLTGSWGVPSELKPLKKECFHRWLFDEGEMENRLGLFRDSPDDLRRIIAHFDRVGWPSEPHIMSGGAMTPQRLLFRFIELHHWKKEHHQLCQEVFDILLKQYAQSPHHWDLQAVLEFICDIPTPRLVKNTTGELREQFISMFFRVLDDEQADVQKKPSYIGRPLRAVINDFSKYFVGPERQRMVDTLERFMNECIDALDYYCGPDQTQSTQIRYYDVISEIVQTAGIFGGDTTVVLLKQLKQLDYPQGPIEDVSFEYILTKIDTALEKISKRK